MRLMIVGSLEGHISAAGKIALAKGANVLHAEDIEQALGALRSGKGADLAMVDVRLKISDFIKALKDEHISVPVVACGLDNDTKAAVKAIKDGAQEYVPLPPDAELISAVLEAASIENSNMIASDPAMQAIIKMADQIAPSTATVLITGESGTGKEVISRYIHEHSKRSEQVFISLNCAAIPENLLESELFGHEKGAFTGAVTRRIGKFEEASGGTLLLDEISEMPLAMQAKLLRAIQERVIDRVGGKSPVPVDLRLIATSNRDLEAEIKLGNFREDLYFRLNVINLHLPALRDRPSDIIPLAKMFADKYSEENGLDFNKELSDEAINKLKNHNWQGNVRELENTMHRAVLISTANNIEPEAIMLSGGSISNTVNIEKTDSEEIANSAEHDDGMENAMAAFAPQTVSDMEKDLIFKTLDHCLGNRTHAAKILGISIRTLRNKLKQYNDDKSGDNKVASKV